MHAILNGLNNIHLNNFIHRDLKPDNIQLAPSGHSLIDSVKIIDFGLSSKMKIGVTSHELKIGTIMYMAPE